MKFLIIAQRFHTNLYYRAKALKDAGYGVKVVVLYRGKSEFYENIDIRQIKLSLFSKLIIKIISFFRKKDLKSSFELRIQSPGKELREVIKSYKPDVIALKAYQNLLALKTLRIAKKYNAKVLMLTQTTLTHIKGSTYLFNLNIKLFKYLKIFAYITPIQSNYEVFRNVGIKNIYYVPFVFPLNENVKNEVQNTIKIISIGKYTKRKDQILLIKAVYELIKKGFDINLNIFGEIADEGYYNSLIDFINKEKLEEKINIFINIPYSEIIKEYSKHNLFVLPSYAEPAAYSIVEAMAYGLPAICSSENGTKCYIEEGKTGYVFEAKNIKNLTEKIERLISDKKKLQTISKNSLISAKEIHNLNNFKNEIIKIVNQE